jgi:hypothetical protein
MPCPLNGSGNISASRRHKLNARLAVTFLLIGVSATSGSPCGAQADPQIIPRTEWHAHAAIAERIPAIKTGKIDGVTVISENTMPLRESAVYLTVHHDVVPARPGTPTVEKMRTFQRNMQNGYWIGTTKHVYLGDTPYHFYVSSTGDIAQGRELKYAAYSNTVYRTPIEQHITVVLEGDFQNKDKPIDKQLAALEELLYWLAKKNNIKLENISYHQKVATTHTDCPGKAMIEQMDPLIEKLRARGLE